CLIFYRCSPCAILLLGAIAGPRHIAPLDCTSSPKPRYDPIPMKDVSRRGAEFRLLFRALAIAVVATACGGTDTTSPAGIASIVVTGAPTGPMLVGATVQLVATPVNSSGAVVSNAGVNWQSSN